MTKVYRLKSNDNAEKHPAGTLCYPLRGWDFGLANDDTRITGIEHKSVTLDPNGDYPSFTVRFSDLEEIHT